MSGQIQIFLGVLFSATQYMILLITLAISTPPSLSLPLYLKVRRGMRDKKRAKCTLDHM